MLKERSLDLESNSMEQLELFIEKFVSMMNFLKYNI